MNIGIDKLGFYAPKNTLDLRVLAQARNIDPDKYTLGLGQKKMALPSLSEDVITMAAEAASSIISKQDIQDIDMVLFATETAVDFSKAAGIYLHDLLNLNPHTRVVELKQACYAATAALFMAIDHVKAHPNKKVLVLASDVAWYGFETAGEATQGAGAIAMIVSKDPKIAQVFDGTTVVKNRSDFYRPSYSSVPMVDGKLSIESYKSILKEADLKRAFDYVCFHMPFAKMANKANDALTYPICDEHVNHVKGFGQDIGNIYNGSLYLSLLSVLMLSEKDLSDETIGLFSYGSGAIGEFFTATIVPSYKQGINETFILDVMNTRQYLSMTEYTETMSMVEKRETSDTFTLDERYIEKHQQFVLSKIVKGHREYKKVSKAL